MSVVGVILSAAETDAVQLERETRPVYEIRDGFDSRRVQLPGYVWCGSVW